MTEPRLLTNNPRVKIRGAMVGIELLINTLSIPTAPCVVNSKMYPFLHQKMKIFKKAVQKMEITGICCPVLESNLAIVSPGWLTENRACLGDLKEQNIICPFPAEKEPLRLSSISKLSYLLGNAPRVCLTNFIA
jgi:hypothetical protein